MVRVDLTRSAAPEQRQASSPFEAHWTSKADGRRSIRVVSSPGLCGRGLIRLRQINHTSAHLRNQLCWEHADQQLGAVKFCPCRGEFRVIFGELYSQSPFAHLERRLSRSRSTAYGEQPGPCPLARGPRAGGPGWRTRCRTGVARLLSPRAVPDPVSRPVGPALSSVEVDRSHSCGICLVRRKMAPFWRKPPAATAVIRPRSSLRAVGSKSRKPGVLEYSFDRLRTSSPCDLLSSTPQLRAQWWPATRRTRRASAGAAGAPALRVARPSPLSRDRVSCIMRAGWLQAHALCRRQP
jgi:hypothetical protein